MMKKLTSLLVMVIMAVAVNAQLFTENFDDGIASTRWTVVEEGTSNVYNLAFDYVGAGLEAAPNGGGLGFKIEVNTTEGVASQVLAFPTDKTFTGKYTLSFDCWMNWTGTDGTTEFALFGVQHTDTEVPNITGLDLAITGDGGSSRDVRLYAEGVEINVDPVDSTAVYVNATQNFTAEPYTLLGDYAGMQWLQVDVKVTADSAFFFVNDALWVKYPKLTDGNILLGYMDLFSSLAADGNNWIVYDNVVVTDDEVGVNTIQHKELVSLYPNPATDVLNVVVTNTSSLELINTVGQIVKRTIVNGTSTVDVSNLTPGMYLAKVTSMNGQVEVHKILVK